MKILEYLSYDFVQYAFIVGTLIALCSAVLGSVIVTRQMAFIGDGLSHVAFGAAAIANILYVTNSLLLELVVTAFFSFFLFRNPEKSRISNDSMLAVISVGGLTCGYMALNIFSNSANLAGDACSFLFGATSILTLTLEKTVFCCVLSVAILGMFIWNYNKIFAITFDEDFSDVMQVRKKYQMILILMIDTIIVLAMNLVGVLLISALIVLPTLTAMQLCKSFRGCVCVSAVVSVIGAVTGILVSILCGTPVGCTIVSVDMVPFLAAYIWRRKLVL